MTWQQSDFGQRPPPKYPDNRFAGHQDQISLPDKAVLIFSHPSVPDALYVHSGANAIKWSYDLNTQTTPTMGGEVTQILSCFVGPMTITGQTAGLRTDIKGRSRTSNPGYNSEASYNANDELKNIIEWFLTYMHSAGQDGKGSRLRDERAILFQYPERGWDFYIQVTALDGFTYDKTVYAPEWSITAEVMDDNALNFFRGITMHSFTDNLISHQILAGFSEFKGGVADTNSKYFGQDGNSKNPFLNPAISASAAELANRMGNNFQALVAAWSTSDFGNFGFNALLDAGAKPIDVDATYQKLFGSTYLGNLPGYSGVGAGVGSATYSVDSGVKIPSWVNALLKAGNWDISYENQAFIAGWGSEEGGGRCVPRKSTCNNWLNVSEPWPNSTVYSRHSNGSPWILNYATPEDGISATIKLMHNGKYSDIIGALKSGNPYTYGSISDGLQTWVAGTNRTPESAAYAARVLGHNAKVVAYANAQSVVIPPGYAAAVATLKPLIVAGKLIFDHDNDKQGLLNGGLVQRVDGSGQPPVQISLKIIQFLIWAASKYPTLRASSIIGQHSQHVSGSTRQSRHWTGEGLDIGSIAGRRVDSTDSKQTVIDFMVAVQHSSVKPNQMICNGAGRWDEDVKRLQLNNYSPTNYVTSDDHTDHVHIGF